MSLPPGYTPAIAPAFNSRSATSSSHCYSSTAIPPPPAYTIKLNTRSTENLKSFLGLPEPIILCILSYCPIATLSFSIRPTCRRLRTYSISLLRHLFLPLYRQLSCTASTYDLAERELNVFDLFILGKSYVEGSKTISELLLTSSTNEDQDDLLVQSMRTASVSALQEQEDEATREIMNRWSEGGDDDDFNLVSYDDDDCTDFSKAGVKTSDSPNPKSTPRPLSNLDQDIFNHLQPIARLEDLVIGMIKGTTTEEASMDQSVSSALLDWLTPEDLKIHLSSSATAQVCLPFRSSSFAASRKLKTQMIHKIIFEINRNRRNNRSSIASNSKDYEDLEVFAQRITEALSSFQFKLTRNPEANYYEWI